MIVKALSALISARDRLTDDDCIGTSFISLQSISGQGEEGILIIMNTTFSVSYFSV